MFLYLHWADAEDGEGIRHVAVTGNECEEKNWLSACVRMISCTGGMLAVQISERPKVEPVCSTLFGHFVSKSNISWEGGLKAYQ